MGLRALLGLAVACFSIPALAHTGSGIAADSQGQVWFLDTGSGLWRIDAHGEMTHVAQQRFHWLTLDAGDAFAATRLPTGANGDIARVGSSPTLLLSSDYPVATGQDGNLYFPSPGPEGALQIVRMLPSGTRTVLAELPPTRKGPLPHLNGICAGPDGSIYYTEDDAIRRITAQGQVSIVATVPAPIDAKPIPGISVDSGPLLRGLAVDPAGVVYVAANGCGSVLKITPEGEATTLLHVESPWSPTAVALSGSDVIVLEFLHTADDDRLAWLPRVRKIDADGKATILATVDRMPGARPK
jgi:streptogramin lyase